MPASNLQQIHAVALAAGAQTTIAHNLRNGNIRRLIPNWIYPDRDTPIRVVSATATDVTYENTDGADAQSANFLVEFQHTIQQATVTAGNPPITFYYQGGGAGGGGTGLITDYIFQPGGGGTGPAVFEDFTVLMAAMDAARAAGGPTPGSLFRLQFDDRATSPVVIPAGAWNMENVEWTGRLPSVGGVALPVLVDVADGATFTQLRRFRGRLFVQFTQNGSTPPVSDVANGDVIEIREGVFIMATGDTPFFDCTGVGEDESCRFIIGESVIGDGDVTTILGDSAGDPAGVLQFVMLDGAIVQELAVEDGGHTWTFLGNSARAEDQAPAGPTVVIVSSTPRWNMRGPFAGGAAVDADYGDFIECDPDTADVGVTLPPIINEDAGLAINVKSVSDAMTFDIVVATTGGDTIDGAASPFTITIARSSFTFVSDGGNNWSIQ